jgi:multidrug resistance efflux pump
MEEKKEKLNRGKRKRMAFIVFPILLAGGAAALYFYLQYVETHISTKAITDVAGKRIHVYSSQPGRPGCHLPAARATGHHAFIQ